MNKLVQVGSAVALLSVSLIAAAVPTDYLVLKWSEASGLESEYHQIVDLPANPINKNHQNDLNSVQLLDANGVVVSAISLKNARFTRAEFHGHDHIDGQVFLNQEVVFVVRAQQGLVDKLRMPEYLDKNKSLVDYAPLVEQAKSKGTQSIEKASGGIDNRINLLFMGDGYTSGQESDFNADVDSVIAYMQTFEPYQSYANFTSYDRIFTPSNQSGADKPAACFTPEVIVDTAFDGSFCIADIQRLVTVNSSKVLTAAAASPNWNEIAVIVNDKEYGGSGGFFSTFSTNASADDIFIHEYGHSFTDLADEYSSEYPGFPLCSDISGAAPCEVNVTDETIRGNIKWNYLVAASTPIPTPETGSHDTVIGLFEGARYFETGMYRPKNFCNMQFLGVSFCEVCQQAYVDKVYAVPYAEGGAQLSLIEPGSANPAATSLVGMVSVAMPFSVDTLQPDHDLEITWLVDNVSQSVVNSSAVTQNFQFIPSQVGMTEVKVRVKDNSILVDASQHDQLPDFEHAWQVDVQPLVDLIFEHGFE